MKMTNRLWLAFVWSLLFSTTLFAQTTAFTYQGKLANNGTPVTVNYDFQFKLFDTDGTQEPGTQIGTTQTATNITVSNGIFAVTLDFVNCPTCMPPCTTCFNGEARFLEILVRPTVGSTYERLAPRQAITSNPYAIKSLNAATADGLSLTCVSCVTSSQIGSVNGSAVTGTIPVASVPAGSGNYIQNTTSPQATSNFNISGDGTVGGTLNGNIVNAMTQFNLGGNRILSEAGFSNLFVGSYAGSNTTGSNNAFFGNGAGFVNTSGSNNAFFGSGAGLNTTGSANAFFGTNAGRFNSVGSNNTFIGGLTGAGSLNDNLSFSTAIGYGASTNPGSLTNATAIGSRAQVTQSNSLVLGSINGTNGAGADTNIGIGTTAPSQRLHVVGNGIFTGDLSVTGLNGNVVNVGLQFNLGGFPALRIPDPSSIQASIFVGNTGLGGNNNSFFGTGAGSTITVGGNANSFFGVFSGRFTTEGALNSFFGTQAGDGNATGDLNTAIGFNADVSTGDLNNATAIGAQALVSQSNSLVLGSISGINGGTDTNIGIGTTAPATRLHVSGTGIIRARVNSDSNAGIALTLGNQPKWSVATVTGGQFQIFNDAIGQNAFWIDSASDNVGIGTTAPADKLHIAGDIRVGTTGTNGCLKNNNGGLIVGTCSSDARFKRDITPFPNLLSRIVQLRPVHFHWRASDYPDRNFGQAREAGLIAQEVEKVMPELVTEDEQGYKAVNYSTLPMLALQAVKELQRENEALKKANAAIKQQQQAQFATQQAQIGAQQSQLNQQVQQIQNQRREIERQQQQFIRLHQTLEALKRLVCSSHRKAKCAK